MGTIFIPKVHEHPGQILVFKEKHGNRYFLAETKEQVYDACLQLLKEREWMFSEPKEPELINIPNDPVLFDNSVDEQLRQDVLTVIEKSKQANKRIEEEYKERLHEYKLAKIAISENNGKLAWRIISDRHDYEYEYFEFEQLENA